MNRLEWYEIYNIDTPLISVILSLGQYFIILA